MLVAMGAIALLAGLVGLLLGLAARRSRLEHDPLAERIDALLPQTQCGQCGFAGCRPYARAIAAGEAQINQCPPGGVATIRALADLLGRNPAPLDPDHGVEKPPTVAVIDEPACIGCTLCIQACPVDAIVGATKLMHTVIASACTGCELCVEPCPVDCIAMVPRQRTGNRILGAGAPEPSMTGQERPCIRCGDCVAACPANLLPQQLYWFARARDFDTVQDFHLFDCTECGCCAAVCPSRIPLVQYYRAAKSGVRALEHERESANGARRRHDYRQLRLAREQRARADRMRGKREALHRGDGAKKEAIAAALARAKAKRAELESARKPTDMF